MAEKKGRPNSLQKRGGTGSDDGRTSGETSNKAGLSVSSKKRALAQTSSKVKTAISSESIVKADLLSVDMKLDGETSSLSLERDSNSLEPRKSATGRKKSASKLSEVGRTVAMRKMLRKLKTKATDVEDEEKEKRKDGKIWDKELENLALKMKAKSEMNEQSGLKQICVVAATPLIENVAVRKRRTAHRNLDVLVMHTASPDAVYTQTCHMGPRYDALGNVIPHSILGDVESFFRHSRQRTEESDRLLLHQHKTAALETNAAKYSAIYSQLFNEENALTTWKREMKNRHHNQNRLAGILKRKEKDLLMCRSEGQCPLYKQRLNQLRNQDGRSDPNRCFWTIGDKCTAGHLQETLMKSAKGQIRTPVLVGYADSIIREKGKVCDMDSDIKDEYMQQKVLAEQGTIHIANKVLFSELQLQGEAIVSDIVNARGDNEEHAKGVNFFLEKTGMADNIRREGNVSNTAGSARLMMKLQPGSEKDDEIEDASGYNFTSSRRSEYQDLVMAQMIEAIKENRKVFDFKFIGQKREILDGPAMLIDGTTLKWCCNGSDNNCKCSDKVLKEVFVLITGNAREIIRSYTKLENVGTTMLRYSWMRVPDKPPLPVPRPRRHCFYFMDDNGVLLPRETVYIPILFKSRGPGYFTESWLLSTQPVLEGRAKVKFTFTGFTTHVPDFSEQCQEIEDYFAQKEAQTLCSQEAKALLEYAVVKSSLEVREEPVVQTDEEIFKEANPGFYYHAYVIGRLQLLCESFIHESKRRKLGNGFVCVCVLDLWKAFLDLPEDDHVADDSDDPADESDDSAEKSPLNLTPKQTLLTQLYTEMNILRFRPFLALEPSKSESKFVILLTLLQTGIDSVVGFAHVLAKHLGLVQVKEVKEADGTHKRVKGNKNKAKVSTKSSKGSKKNHESPEFSVSTSPHPDSLEQQQEVPVFSAAHKYRTENTDNTSPMLAQYDEKVYIEVYSMLEKTVEEMSVLFEHL